MAHKRKQGGEPPERMPRQDVHESRFEPIRPATRNPQEWARRSAGQAARKK